MTDAQRLAKIEGLAASNQAVLGQVHEDVIELKVHVIKQNSRLSQLELWQARVEGAGTALKAQWPILVVGVSVATAVIVKVL